ncbi:hypothetical protein GCM10009754_16130 [Amycolatopsis minnesotensis]|uniref:Uncharacterized protein n=1 Tax=Amycolatopsis minnesotensis TaxID=337894 RepID=A0ABN2QAP7_9PSEU
MPHHPQEINSPGTRTQHVQNRHSTAGVATGAARRLPGRDEDGKTSDQSTRRVLRPGSGWCRTLPDRNDFGAEKTILHRHGGDPATAALVVEQTSGVGGGTAPADVPGETLRWTE